jgi:hypothetical protein
VAQRGAACFDGVVVAGRVPPPPHAASATAKTSAAGIQIDPLLTLYRHFRPVDVVLHD